MDKTRNQGKKKDFVRALNSGLMEYKLYSKFTIKYSV